MWASLFDDLKCRTIRKIELILQEIRIQNTRTLPQVQLIYSHPGYSYSCISIVRICTHMGMDLDIPNYSFCLLFFPAGRSLATKYGCKYIETSPGINHNVDELLVGMLTQLTLREQAAETKSKGDGKSRMGMKVMDLLERVIKIQNNKSKSCGNLHVL